MAVQHAGTVAMQFHLASGGVRTFMASVGELAESVAGADGYLGRRDHVDPSGCRPTIEWRFRTMAEAAEWAHGSAVASFLSAIEAVTEREPIVNVLDDDPAERREASTLVVTTKVKEGEDRWFADWQGRMAAAEQQYPGFLGQRVQAPVQGVNPHWVAVMAFDTEAHLKAWTESPERKALLEESAPHVQRYDVRPASSAFESWFAKGESGVKPPPAWKLSAIVLLVLYPVVMLEFFTVNHFTQDDWNLDPALGVFIGNAISVAITGFILIPWASKLLNWWLVPPLAVAARRTWQGVLLLIGIYALSVVVFAVLIALFPHLMP